MTNVIVFCGDAVSQATVTMPDSSTAYVAACSSSWQTVAAPANAPLDGEEFAGFFLGVLVSTLTFYFVGVLPIGMFLRFIRQSIRNLL